MKKRGLSMMLIVPAIRWGEWMLLGATGAAVVALKAWGVGDVSIFFLLWAGNLLIEWCLIAFNDSTDVDVTLMEGLRRLVDKAFEQSLILGIVIEILVVVRLIIWDGAAYFIIFFQKRLVRKSLKISLFVFSCGLQMAVWTVLYIYGYESFSDLFAKLF
ncbi:MAG: hypothetical protein WCI36_02690 [bacterium]